MRDASAYMQWAKSVVSTTHKDINFDVLLGKWPVTSVDLRHRTNVHHPNRSDAKAIHPIVLYSNPSGTTRFRLPFCIRSYRKHSTFVLEWHISGRSAMNNHREYVPLISCDITTFFRCSTCIFDLEWFMNFGLWASSPLLDRLLLLWRCAPSSTGCRTATTHMSLDIMRRPFLHLILSGLNECLQCVSKRMTNRVAFVWNCFPKVWFIFWIT